MYKNGQGRVLFRARGPKKEMDNHPFLHGAIMIAWPPVRIRDAMEASQKQMVQSRSTIPAALLPCNIAGRLTG